MGIRSVLAVSLLAVMPTLAQEISAEADKAMWCATAITLLDTMGAYPPEAENAVALARIWSRRAVNAFDAAGFSDEEIDVLADSYLDELSMQLPDYLISSDEDALRLNIHACFEP